MPEYFNRHKSSLPSNRSSSITTSQVLLFSYFVIVFLIIVVPLFYSNPVFNIDLRFVLTNCIIGFTAVFMIIKEIRYTPYSLNMIHWIFQFMFFHLAPLAQYYNNEFRWGNLFSYDIHYLLLANMMILLWQVTWIFTQALSLKKKSYLNNKVTEESGRKKLKINKANVYFAFFLALVATLFFIITVDFQNLFFRNTFNSEITFNSGVSLIITRTFRAFPIVAFIGVYFLYKDSLSIEEKNFCKFLLILTALMILLTNFPLAAARYWIAAVYMGIFFTVYKLKSKIFFPIFLTSGLVILFPLLSSIRYSTSLNGLISSIMDGNLFINSFFSGDFDAYSMLVYTLKFVFEGPGHTFGYQLVGVIGFFIPRTFWETKPVGSGYTVSDALNLTYDNVSNPLIAEGIINFGIIGVILFAIFFSFLIKRYDNYYWRNRKANNESKSFFLVLYPFILGFFFFMLRGDLLSSFAFVVGFMIAFIPLLVNIKLSTNKAQ